MTKYIYKVIIIKDEFNYQNGITEPNSPLSLLLNEYGESGWELTQIIPMPNQLYLKCIFIKKENSYLKS